MIFINFSQIDKIIACSVNPQFSLWLTAIRHLLFTNNKNRDSEHAKDNFYTVYMFADDIKCVLMSV